jgi:hypothetical protein
VIEDAIRVEAARLFHYSPETGVFTRKVRSGSRGCVGSVAGGEDAEGYVRLRIFGSKHAAHRIAWVMHYGRQPEGLIDHINGDTSDNRIANLRVVDNSTNLENQRRARSDNALGVMGVRRRNTRFEARICVKGQAQQIGTFDTAKDAHAAYLCHKRAMHKGCTI